MRSTQGFWEHFVLPKINDDFRRLYTFLNDPYPDGPIRSCSGSRGTSRGCGSGWPRRRRREKSGTST